MALPSNAVDPSALHAGGLGASAGRGAEPQSFVASPRVHHPEATRHGFSATTMEELEAAREKQRAAELEFAAAKQRALDAAAAGLPADQIAAASGADPVAPAEVPDGALAAERGSIVSVARQYLGVPYVFGGASPSGFDCSGLVLYVYAQFGIALPHSSLRQGANGTRVSDPVPGDLVVLDGGNHIGIYSGNGHMIDAPMPGRVVNERPIYTSNHFFVRY
jgi:cell wall-associated NlpC family hydrolase